MLIVHPEVMAARSNTAVHLGERRPLPEPFLFAPRIADATRSLGVRLKSSAPPFENEAASAFSRLPSGSIRPPEHGGPGGRGAAIRGEVAGDGGRRRERCHVVLVAMVVLVVDVVVDPAPVTDTLHPAPVAGRIATELVSKRVFTVRPMAVVALAVAATSKVIMATLTTPVGNVRLELWKADRLVVPGVGVFVVGLPENWAVLPPATDATVRTAGSYVTAIS